MGFHKDLEEVACKCWMAAYMEWNVDFVIESRLFIIEFYRKTQNQNQKKYGKKII